MRSPGFDHETRIATPISIRHREEPGPTTPTGKRP
jgi:hypothetical protein